jgi:predicted kinase
MATAHLLHGYLGVGKTTLARHLEHELPAVRFTHDEWMTRLYGDDPDVERAEFEDMCRRVHAQMEPVWSRCLQLGLDVVLDFGLWSRQERDALRAKIVALGVLARLYRVTCSDSVAWQRIEKRNTELSGDFLIVRNTYDVRSGFEPLEDDEERIEIAASRNSDVTRPWTYAAHGPRGSYVCPLVRASAARRAFLALLSRG